MNTAKPTPLFHSKSKRTETEKKQEFETLPKRRGSTQIDKKAHTCTHLTKTPLNIKPPIQLLPTNIDFNRNQI